MERNIRKKSFIIKTFSRRLCPITLNIACFTLPRKWLCKSFDAGPGHSIEPAVHRCSIKSCPEKFLEIQPKRCWSLFLKTEKFLLCKDSINVVNCSFSAEIVWAGTCEKSSMKLSAFDKHLLQMTNNF